LPERPFFGATGFPPAAELAAAAPPLPLRGAAPLFPSSADRFPPPLEGAGPGAGAGFDSLAAGAAGDEAPLAVSGAAASSFFASLREA
jgi:hypothetical protein